MFYIFIDEDAIKISSITTLKLINLTKDIVKCGFPEKTFQKYLNIFENLNLKIKIIENENSNTEFESLINKIKKRYFVFLIFITNYFTLYLSIRFSPIYSIFCAL